jgi:cholera toxin transcriptional activator
MSGHAARRVFCFGPFEATEATGELRKHGVRIKLHSQPYRVLVMLLERPSEVVTREEMQQRLWGKDTFVDFDHGLNTAVNKIREALGDSASEPRYVETVSGRGYRFIAPVTLRAPILEGSENPIAAPAEAVATGSTRTATAPPVAASSEPERAEQPLGIDVDVSRGTLLTAPHELPTAPRKLVRILLLLVQAMYLGFYLGALANLQEIHDIFVDANLVDANPVAANLLSPAALVALLVTTAAVLIPVRLYLFAAVSFDFQQLPSKFRKLFPVLLILDLLWALSPFLLIHHVSIGLALGMSAALVYMPFAQRSLVLMYARAR